MTQNFDEKDTSVFTKKKRSLLSLKSHFCHKKDTSVTKYVKIFHNFYASVKRTLLSHQKTVLSFKKLLKLFWNTKESVDNTAMKKIKSHKFGN